MGDGNSLRDHVKDAIRECLSKSGIDQDKANEMTYDLADTVFDALSVPAEYQDKDWEHEVEEIAGLYYAREPLAFYQEDN